MKGYEGIGLYNARISQEIMMFYVYLPGRERQMLLLVLLGIITHYCSICCGNNRYNESCLLEFDESWTPEA